MNLRQQPGSAFTLIELLVVIVIIAVLMGLAFPAFQAVMNQARKTQAKNDLTQIVTAVNAYYTEYGKYPLLDAQVSAGTDAIFTTDNDKLFNVLRMPLGFADSQNASGPQNPRKISFISPPDAKDSSVPRSGMGTATGAGQFFDPWGIPYRIKIDGDYDNQITNPYTANTGAGGASIQQGVIAWSFGTDALSDTAAQSSKSTGTNKDDVISWQ